MITYNIKDDLINKYFNDDKIKINVIDTNLTTLKDETITQYKNGYKNYIYRSTHYIMKDRDTFKMEHNSADETVHYHIDGSKKVIDSTDLFEYFSLPVGWFAILKEEYACKFIEHNGKYVEDISKDNKYKFFVNVYNLYEGLKEIEKWKTMSLKKDKNNNHNEPYISIQSLNLDKGIKGY